MKRKGYNPIGLTNAAWQSASFKSLFMLLSDTGRYDRAGA